jgi:hypothetical protein
VSFEGSAGVDVGAITGVAGSQLAVEMGDSDVAAGTSKVVDRHISNLRLQWRQLYSHPVGDVRNWRYWLDRRDLLTVAL